MPRWGATPLCGLAAAGWNGCEVSSPSWSNGQMAAAIAAEAVELEQKPGDSQIHGSPVQADVVTSPLQPIQTKIDLIIRVTMMQ